VILETYYLLLSLELRASLFKRLDSSVVGSLFFAMKCPELVTPPPRRKRGSAASGV